jgi:spore coat polysaccharide biosynthesis protein SpsF
MIVAIIQARTGSTRLPNKIFMELCDRPLIYHIVNRLRPSSRIDKIVIATTINPDDDILELWAKENEIECFRGNENDVLSRYYFAAKKYNANTIIRITADDPFKDFTIIDRVINLFEVENLDFANNNNPPTFPEGLDTEVFTFKALELAFQNAKTPFEREHVTQYFYNNVNTIQQKCLKYHVDLSNLRLTIDTKHDLEMAVEIYEKLYPLKEIFNLDDIIEFLNKEPHIKEINSKEKRSTMYKNKKI